MKKLKKNTFTIYNNNSKKKLKLYNLIFTLNMKNVRMTYTDNFGNVILKIANKKFGFSPMHTYENLRKLIRMIREYMYKIRLHKKYKVNLIFNGTKKTRSHIKKALYKENYTRKLFSFIENSKSMHNGPKKKKKKRK